MVQVIAVLPVGKVDALVRVGAWCTRCKRSSVAIDVLGAALLWRGEDETPAREPSTSTQIPPGRSHGVALGEMFHTSSRCNKQRYAAMRERLQGCVLGFEKFAVAPIFHHVTKQVQVQLGLALFGQLRRVKGT